MAPSAIQEPSTTSTFEAKGAPNVDKLKTTLVNTEGLKYPEYYPYNDPNDVIFEDAKPFDYHDRALDADPAMPVFYNDHVTVEEVSASPILPADLPRPLRHNGVSAPVISQSCPIYPTVELWR